MQLQGEVGEKTVVNDSRWVVGKKRRLLQWDVDRERVTNSGDVGVGIRDKKGSGGRS